MERPAMLPRDAQGSAPYVLLFFDARDSPTDELSRTEDSCGWLANSRFFKKSNPSC